MFNWIFKGVNVEKRKPKTRSQDAVMELQQLSSDFNTPPHAAYTASELGAGSAASILFEHTERQGNQSFTQFDPNAPFSGGQQYISNIMGGNTSSGFGASALGGSSYGNRNILVVTPSSNAEVTEVVTNLRNGDACVVCLEGLDITDAQRRLDFLSGVICAMNGTIKRLNANTYILTPTGIGVRKQQGN